MARRAVFVRALILCAFQAHAACTAAANTAESGTSLPPVTGGHYDYPLSARRLGQQGRFLVEFSIDGDGHAADVALLSAEPSGIFDRSLIVNLRKARFSVPRDWTSSGRSKHRFRVNIIFLIRPCRETGPCVALPPLTTDPVITFTGAPIGDPEPR